MEKDCTAGQMGENCMEIGTRVNSMVNKFMNLNRKKLKKVFGRTERKYVKIIINESY